jgi:hypothetical protein
MGGDAGLPSSFSSPAQARTTTHGDRENQQAGQGAFFMATLERPSGHPRSCAKRSSSSCRPCLFRTGGVRFEHGCVFDLVSKTLIRAEHLGRGCNTWLNTDC